MISLVFSVCLIEQPGICKDVVNTYDAPGLTIPHCMNGAQRELAKWIGDHPQWRIERWKCVDASKPKIDI